MSNLETLKNEVRKGKTDQDWKQAKLEIEQEKAEREKRKAQAAEERRIWEAEQMKPEVFVPREARAMHVELNRLDFEKKCAKCDREALIRYTQELKAGLHREEFRDTATVINFLEAQLQKRKEKNAEDILASTKK